MKVLHAARTVAMIAASLAAPLAGAHTGHDEAGLVSGFVHPFAGFDHMLAMLAIGAWAAQQTGRARVAIPLAFIAAMGAGAVAGFAGQVQPAAEPMIAASVLALGLAVAAAIRAPRFAGVTIAALFAVVHGMSHGAEAANVPHASYLCGMLLATAILHGAGFATGIVVRATALRWAGATLALGGVGMMLVGV